MLFIDYPCAAMKFVKSIAVSLTLLWFVNTAIAQSPEFIEAERSLDSLMSLVRSAEERVQALKIKDISHHLKKYGLPLSPFDGEVVMHSAMALEYVQEFKQAAWVYHVILPEIENNIAGRTNDFRSDSLISSGTAVQEDFFLTSEGDDGQTVYDGFGYDRGHLAPSADFRWSEKVLSESYYYSNIAPQLPGFNRDGWVQLENLLRSYVLRTQRPLYVVTAGVLHNDLPRLKRSLHQVAVPEYFYKVAFDPEVSEGIAFLIPHSEVIRSPHYYAIAIDSLESFTGIDFFPSAPAATDFEAGFELQHWFPDLAHNKTGLDPLELPKNTFTAAQAAYQAGTGRNVQVCGHVVSASASRKGNVFLVFDEIYPEKKFQVFISDENKVNFDSDPVSSFDDKCICVRGKVEKLGETPTMFIEHQKAMDSCDEYLRAN
jgi:endonuclease G